MNLRRYSCSWRPVKLENNSSGTQERHTGRRCPGKRAESEKLKSKNKQVGKAAWCRPMQRPLEAQAMHSLMQKSHA